MNPAKVIRAQVHRLTDLPNIGQAMAQDLELIGIKRPDQLTGQHPLHLYEKLCLERGVRQDPCVLDTFISVTHFMNGDEPRPWWTYTDERKRLYGSI
ncbi:MAG: helix-hairpin-helix domain-containing protein [Rhodoferax sp.]|nr:helix-hairpin-helix domain-containing protein [Rhodoferax sp.]